MTLAAFSINQHLSLYSPRNKIKTCYGSDLDNKSKDPGNDDNDGDDREDDLLGPLTALIPAETGFLFYILIIHYL